MNLFFHKGIQVKQGQEKEIDDRIIREDRFSIFLNDLFLAEIVASGDQLEELGAGFVTCQGLVKELTGVKVNGDQIRIEGVFEDCSRGCLVSTNSQGFQRPVGTVTSGFSMTSSEVYAVTREIETEVWRQTGGVHCSVLYHAGNVVVKSSDIGRHNTVDKVVGYAVLHGIDLSQSAIGCTGRQPRDMVLKYSHAGIPIVISRAASTDRGILTAEEAGITLICFSRTERFTIYAHPWRIRDLGIPRT